MKLLPQTRRALTIVAGTGLLVAGIVIHLALVQPQQNRVRALAAQRTQLLQTAADRRMRSDLERQRLEALGMDDSASFGPRADAVAMIGDAVDASGLHRLELGTTSNSDLGGVRHTSLFVRATGSYRQISRLVLDLERRERLVAVEAIRIEPVTESSDLELRLRLSVYDPLPKGTEGGN
ncbi:MAG: GspMb/PilO family protein [Candidatus Eisenbacteria bacterium]|nr:GspMb/PilO family protein [Candidatus Eisenbacteria bacterium]